MASSYGEGRQPVCLGAQPWIHFRRHVLNTTPAPPPLPIAPPRRFRVALAAGGTAGHVYPALAVAEAFRERRAADDLLFIGSADGFEARLVPACGYRLETVAAAPLFGVGPVRKMHALAVLCVGFLQARRIVQAHAIELVIGFGGYASAAALLAARSLGVRTALHEANVIPGLTNRLLSRFVERVYLGSAAASAALRSRSVLVTGHPVRAAMLAAAGGMHLDGPHRILVVGGSQGAHFLNQHVPDLLARVADDGVAIEVQHQVGSIEAEVVRARYAAAGIAADVVAYIDDMASAYAWADFAIARAGAGTIAELAVCALPAMLVPLPSAAGGHQAANAEACARAGGWAVHEDQWHVPTLAARLTALLRNEGALKAAAARMRELAVPDAAARVVADCEVTFRESRSAR